MGLDLLFDEAIYTLPDGQGALLASDLRGYASGSEPDEVARVIRAEVAGLHWTDDAPRLATLIEETLADRREGPVAIDGEAIETLRAALGPIVDGSETAPGAGPAGLLTALRALDCKVCWGLGWTPSFAVGATAASDGWRECPRCLGKGTRSRTGPDRPKPGEPPRRH